MSENRSFEPIDEETDPTELRLEAVLREHAEFVDGCQCGVWEPSEDNDYVSHLLGALMAVRPHTCPPGKLIWKFDGGRGALLCSTCYRIVGYGPAGRG